MHGVITRQKEITLLFYVLSLSETEGRSVFALVEEDELIENQHIRRIRVFIDVLELAREKYVLGMTQLIS